MKAHLASGRREALQIRNIFWQDLLEYFAAHPPPCGIYGVNVNPHVRYLQVAHVAGCAHLPVLERCLKPARSARFSLELVQDPRFPLHAGIMVPDFFARHLEAGLHAFSLQDEQFRLDRPAAGRLLERYQSEQADDLQRRLLLRALWTRDLPVDDFHTLAADVPLSPSAEYLDQFASRLDRLILEHILSEQPLPVLRQMNERLGAARRRGLISVIAQELQERGWDFRAIREDPVVGPHARRMDRVRAGLLEGWEPVALFREALAG